MERIASIPLNFQLPVPGPISTISVEAVAGGLINDTWTTTIAGHHQRYILQRINVHVFEHVDELMSNIDKVSRHLQSKRERKLNSDGTTIDAAAADSYLIIIPTKDDQLFYREKDADGRSCGIWRMYNYIPNSITYPVAPDREKLYEAGRAYGKFQRDLSDFPSPHELYETIPDFHNTVKRMKSFRKAVLDDVCNRAQYVQEEIGVIESKAELTNIIVDMLSDGRLPLRVTHNDTKLENVLFDISTHHALCVVDYDTIMPNGSMLYDYGDAIRSMSNSASEDEQNLTKVEFDAVSCQRFTEGFLHEVDDIITENERRMLPIGAMIITLEQAIRFLTDYLMGDTYFKTDYSDHNLARARNQLKLMQGMEMKIAGN